MSHAAARAIASSDAAATPAGRTRRSVLVVCDDPDLTRTCLSALRRTDFDVSWVRHSGHALLRCLEGYPADVLLTELCMADGSGPALANRLRRHCPDMQSLYLASPGMLLVPEVDVLVRPFSRDDLLARMAALSSWQQPRAS